ncbi:DJ-1/PfpI family protein [Bacillus sp. FJAT-51639]|uniref:DJ-1/PfpI family protein n=1 Tax=Bacillus bruguierae TaxID=3127667 RepID=A0ABU8FIF6_9BACI
MKKVLFLAYPQYADFEIAHALFLLRKVGKAKITTVSVDGKPVESIGGLWTQVEASLSEITVNEFDLVLISGGDGVHEIVDKGIVSETLMNAFNLHIPIASICASAILLGKAGVLNDRKFTCLQHTYENNKVLFETSVYTGTDIEVEDTIITAKGTAFAEFAVAACQLMDLLKEKEKLDSTLKFCKGITS